MFHNILFKMGNNSDGWVKKEKRLNDDRSKKQQQEQRITKISLTTTELQ